MAQFPSIPGLQLPMIISPEFRTVIVGDNKLEQRTSDLTTEKYTFEAGLDYVSDAHKKIIFAFFISRNGIYESFWLYNPEDESSYAVRFVESVLELEKFKHSLWNLGRIKFTTVNESPTLDLPLISDEVYVSESMEPYMPIDILIFDTGSIIETINMLDLIVECVAVDTSSIVEDVVLDVPIGIDVNDVLSIVEDIETMLLSYCDVNDTSSITENVSLSIV